MATPARPEWLAVDRYVGDVFALQDAALAQAAQAAARAGLPDIAVSAPQGRLLELLARLRRPHLILELGTLGGYSTICLARSLEAGGRLFSLELSEHHADVARQSVAAAGLGELVEIRTTPALEGIAALAAEGQGPFDLIFFDADKAPMGDYFLACLPLAAPDALLIFDNTVRGGGLADEASSDPSVLGVRRLHELLAAEPRVRATTIQTVGDKGHDGLTLALLGG
jgi:predicted O-methyltransferase YrrM